MSIHVSAVAPDLKFFTGPIKAKNQLVLNVEQKRCKRFSPFLASHLEEGLFLLPQEQVVPPADIGIAVVADRK
jgi:hypothetical protein